MPIRIEFEIIEGKPVAVESDEDVIPNVGDEVVVTDRKNVAEVHKVTGRKIDYTTKPVTVTISLG